MPTSRLMSDLRAMAPALGRSGTRPPLIPRPLRVPLWLAKLVGGKQAGTFASELRGASNEKAKRELGWQPAHPSWRGGFAESLAP